MCTSLRKYKQNPKNVRGAMATWLSVLVALHKHFLTHVIHCFISFACVMFVDLWTGLLLSPFHRSKLVKSRCQVKFSSSLDSARQRTGRLWTSKDATYVLVIVCMVVDSAVGVFRLVMLMVTILRLTRGLLACCLKTDPKSCLLSPIQSTSHNHDSILYCLS
jgi:hypothetical protein